MIAKPDDLGADLDALKGQLSSLPNDALHARRRYLLLARILSLLDLIHRQHC